MLHNTGPGGAARRPVTKLCSDVGVRQGTTRNGTAKRHAASAASRPGASSRAATANVSPPTAARAGASAGGAAVHLLAPPRGGSFGDELRLRPPADPHERLRVGHAVGTQ